MKHLKTFIVVNIIYVVVVYLLIAFALYDATWLTTIPTMSVENRTGGMTIILMLMVGTNLVTEIFLDH